MRIKARYSHLNGHEYLQVHHPDLWGEVEEVVRSVDAEACRTKVSEERGTYGKLLYSPVDMNKAFGVGFTKREWRQRRSTFWVTSDEQVMRGVYALSADDQRRRIVAAGHEPIMSYNQTDFRTTSETC